MDITSNPLLPSNSLNRSLKERLREKKRKLVDAVKSKFTKAQSPLFGPEEDIYNLVCTIFFPLYFSAND